MPAEELKERVLILAHIDCFDQRVHFNEKLDMDKFSYI